MRHFANWLKALYASLALIFVGHHENEVIRFQTPCLMSAMISGSDLNDVSLSQVVR